MTVTYIRGKSGLSKSNIVFPKSWPMRFGKFPKSHPCGDNPEPTIFCSVPETDDPLGKFRARGYLDASCFPEGDGICFQESPEKTDRQVMTDISECFGWIVRRK